MSKDNELDKQIDMDVAIMNHCLISNATNLTETKVSRILEA